MSEEAEASILNEIANAAREGMTDGVGAHLDGEGGGEQQYEDPGTPLENEYAPQEESEDEDDIQITIGDIRTNVTFRPPPSGQRGTTGSKQAQKLDIDATANANGVPIFDLDLASLEEKPWRKPGADITDYFNYGFVEETWQIYCERQRKLRAEYGSAANANKQLFSSITNLMPVGNLPISEIKPTVKIMPVNSSPAMNLGPPPVSNMISSATEIPIIMRTILTAPPVSDSSTSIATVLTPAVPTPAVQPFPENVQAVLSLAANVPMPQAVHNIQTVRSNVRSQSSPPESPSITPPPDDDFPTGPMPPSSSAENSNMIPGSVAGSGPSVTTAASDSLPFVDLSVPPPRFPPTNLPPPGFHPPHGIPGLPPTNVPPPMFPPGPLPPPGMPIRFPPPFGFPPPGGPRLPPFRDGYAGFNQIPREEARSPASYSDKSSDDERERYERHRRSRGDPYRRSHSRSHRHSSRERQQSRHGRHHSRPSKERERSFYRGGGGSGGPPGEDREHHEEHKRPRERSHSRERSKMRKVEDEELQKIKKRKIKEELPDEEELAEKDVSRKKSKERTEHKDRSLSGKKRKKTKDRHDDDDGEPNS